MKHLLVPVVAVFSCIWFIQCNQAEAKKEKENRELAPTNMDKAVEGTWRLVWSEHNNERNDMSNHVQVKMFTGGDFFLFAHDTAGTMKVSG